jgi:hypothetical protein
MDGKSQYSKNLNRRIMFLPESIGFEDKKNVRIGGTGQALDSIIQRFWSLWEGKGT